MIDRASKTTTATLIDVGMAELEDKFYAVVEQRYLPRPEERVKLGTGGIERLDWAAPEARAGQGWTAKSDVWSLGLLLYRLLTGKRPTNDAAGVLVSPREVQARCSNSLASAVLAALNSEPEERVDAVELLELLDLAAEELAEEAGGGRTATTSATTVEPKPATPPTTVEPKPVTPPPVAVASRDTRPRTRARAGLGVLGAMVVVALVWRSVGGDASDATQVAAVEPSPSPPASGATQAAVVTPPPSRASTLLASSDLPTLPMRQALGNAAESLRRCSALVGGLLVVEFTTAERRDNFATVKVTSRTNPDVDRCVSDATASVRFQPPEAPQLFTEEYTP